MESNQTNKDFRDCISSGREILMEGALGERLKREFHLSFNDIVAMGDLVCREEGRIALKTIWEEYIDISRRYHLPFIATTPTRRANRERIEAAGYDESIILRNVAFLREIEKTADIEMYIGGLMGCKGDAYTGEGSLSIEEACRFHSWQANLFKEVGTDFLYAGIMPALPEATGMAMAMSETGLPYIISFTIQEDGKLIDGTTIDEAICLIDDNVQNTPIGYMTNCVHPAIAYKALSQTFNQTEKVKTRFIGIQANTSALPYNQLDAATDLKTSLPVSLADDMMKLKSEFQFKIFGGCCGTDNKHMEEIAKRLNTYYIHSK